MSEYMQKEHEDKSCTCLNKRDDKARIFFSCPMLGRKFLRHVASSPMPIVLVFSQFFQRFVGVCAQFCTPHVEQIHFLELLGLCRIGEWKKNALISEHARRLEQ